jgi:hypothetical protein
MSIQHMYIRAYSRAFISRIFVRFLRFYWPHKHHASDQYIHKMHKKHHDIIMNAEFLYHCRYTLFS